MRADLLADPVDGVDEVLAVVAGADQALAAGLLRSQAVQAAGLLWSRPVQAAGLIALVDAVAASPLPELQWFPPTRVVV